MMMMRMVVGVVGVMMMMMMMMMVMMMMIEIKMKDGQLASVAFELDQQRQGLGYLEDLR
jgi:hypothetical protein